MWWRAGNDVKRAPNSAPFFFQDRLRFLLASASELALVASGRIPVDKSLASRAIELLHSLPTICIGAGGGAL